MDVAGKVAIVTGASSGVGAQVAARLAQLGASVVVNYANSLAGAQQTASAIEQAGGQAVICRADVSDQLQCEALVQTAVDTFGRLDILVNNAGTTTYVQHAELDLLTDEIWQSTMGTNLMGPFYMTRAAVPELRKQGGAEVVMTSSIAATTTYGSSMAYCASKAALNSMTRCLAKALGADNIRVNAICPGLIDGSWAQQGWGDGWESAKASAAEQAPLSAVASPGDIADSIVSVITGSDLMTGQLITLDAGFTLS